MSDARFYVTTPIPEPALTLLRAAGSVEVPDETPNRARLREVCVSGDYDVVVAQLRDTFDADLLSAAKIRGISNYAVGFNNVDIDAATANSILVGNTSGVLTDATADVAMLLIMATARRAVEADAFLRSGQFTGWEPNLLLGQDVSGRKLGLAGFGRIARATAKRALAFGMQVLFCPRPPGGRPVPDEELGVFAGLVTHTDWDTLVTTSDYLSLHVPLNAQTRHLVDAGVLAAMKPSAILINTARGPVVDEAALVAALQSGEIAGAGLDVYEDEPNLAPGLADLPNTVLLPHIGSATVSVRAEMARLCAENAVAMAQNRIPPHPVNPEAWGV
ncbi:D-glycerate dehydrogenase [Nocardia sp. NPDC050378]|uniref:2-hydroxyacid dehydrogenase n=1 Tax=Nocardia sp. NPDC050378 TaxID=3155400 RepID=UPI0033D28EED